jgi:hypothetical protein
MKNIFLYLIIYIYLYFLTIFLIKKIKNILFFKSKFKYLIIKKLNILKLEKLQNISKT